MLTDYQIVEVEDHGISLQNALAQLDLFRKGAPYLKLYRSATQGDGIQTYSLAELSKLATYYEQLSNNLNITKFVPASGAASRMFKDLFEYLEESKELVADKFFGQLSSFPFYDQLLKLYNSETFDYKHKSEEERKKIISLLLKEKGLNYGNLPKGLLLFHRYADEIRTAFEEHLVEGAGYATTNGKVNLHLTVSPEHMQLFANLFEEVKPDYERKYGVKYELSFSTQKAATDTIAATADNEPFEDRGHLIFRPGGHGALLENLNDINADIVFIKNIDNVAPDAMKPTSFLYKKALAGLLLEIRDRIFEILHELENGTPTKARLQELADEVCKRFQLCISNEAFEKEDVLADFLWKQLYRPIRVCGMVRNDGEPGGGPFWANGKNGEVTLQIVESSQINPNDAEQQRILKSSTHFNPVDLVCSVKDLHGRKFDLTKYRDPNAVFISIKSKNGRELKALELPGLWNGAMSDWITIFVEVPKSTFTPVKTVFDLLRPEHQTTTQKSDALETTCEC
jgi:hypothetical protein